MTAIPQINPVDNAVEQKLIEDPQRSYIGLSAIGGACQRKIWYDFRFCYTPEFSPRILRLFARGNYEEDVAINDLTRAGVKVHSRQIEVVDQTGHVKGHPDGIAENVPGAERTDHLLEVKTMKHSRFMSYIKTGLKKFNPAYWAQIHQYMGRLGLKRTLFVATDKDTEQRDYRRYKFDEENFETHNRIAFDILISERPPKKIGEKTWFECKFCSAKDICHNGHPIERSCRTCVAIIIKDGGKFGCSFYDMDLTVFHQKNACRYYRLDPVIKDV